MCCVTEVLRLGDLFTTFLPRPRIYDSRDSRVSSPDPTTRALLRLRPRENYQCPQTPSTLESEVKLSVRARRELAHRRKRYVEEELRSCTRIWTLEDGFRNLEEVDAGES